MIRFGIDNWFRNSLLLLTLSATLVGCSEPQIKPSAEALQHQLVQLNGMLRRTEAEHIPPLPFDEPYLKQRHELYQALGAVAATPELSYLVIAERFPERYLPWPIYSDISVVLQTQTPQVRQQWFAFVHARLQQAQESRIYLTRQELDYIQTALQTFPASQAKQQLVEYLAGYKPRSRSGLDQIPNGSEWYQSKLNYFSQQTHAPLVWMQMIAARLPAYANESHRETETLDFDKAWLQEFITKRCEPVRGLDWQFDYVNLVETVALCQVNLNDMQKQLWLTIMMLDVGIHYQGWNEQLATQFITEHLDLTADQVSRVLQQVARYPGAVFVLWPVL
ncbi:hypothetical protein ACFOEE_07420 [Pseudoalteromonas fenneropenaei]|uniref:DUF3080 domain-containing protein n=1 Tax=Pseudoalteromonas fenneropenaei TaxID=1737459 RepID=A0ABV7CIC1_9GAMM